MPAFRPASPLLLILVGMVFVAGMGFGAVVAFTQPRSEQARATPDTTPTEPDAKPDTQPTAATPSAEPTRKAEPKPEPKKPDPKPTPKTEPKKPDPPKKPEPPKVEMVSYEKQVFPIFKAKCLTCHGDPQKKADLDLKTLATALMGGSSGPGAVPGKLEGSSIWESIADGSMPPPNKEKLTDAEKKVVKDWILSGAK